MKQKYKRKRAEAQRKYLQQWSKADYTETAMIHFKTHPEDQLPYRLRMSKYAMKKLYMSLDEGETNRRWKQ